MISKKKQQVTHVGASFFWRKNLLKRIVSLIKRAKDIKEVIGFFILWKVIVYSFAYIGILLLPLQISFITDYEFWLNQRLPYIIWIWANFDGNHYIHIAKQGYNNVFFHPFFPLFPMLIALTRLAFNLSFRYVISGQVVSNIAFFISLFVVYKILKYDKCEKYILLTFLTIILFPTSLFYGAIYNDSLFFLFATLTIYFSRKKSWIAASIMGMIAMLTRLNGLALGFIVLLEYITQNETLIKTWNRKVLIKNIKKYFAWRRILFSGIISIILIPLALVAYLYYTQVMFGDWNLVFSAMKIWHQDKITFPPQVVWRYIKILISFNELYPKFSYALYVAAFELLTVIFYVFMMFFSYKKMRLSYWIFFVISILIPSLTGTFQGMPRYALHIYPLFLSLAILLYDKKWQAKIAYFVISAVLLLICTAMFTRGYFIA